MNQREPTSVPQCTGWTSPCLALLLLSLLSGARALAHQQPVIRAPALPAERPYLVALGAPPLRFQESGPAPGLAVRPPKPGAPPPEPADSAPALSEALAHSTSEYSPTMEHSRSESAEASINPESSPTPPVRTSRPILPDDVRPQARAEDFLPFFQIPVTQSGDINLVVPVPRAPAAASSLPLSSATYTQTPR